MHASLPTRCLAESLCTFCMVLIGCGSIVVDGVTGGALGLSGIALVWGLIVMVMIYAVGKISGAHMNPAITVAFVSQRRLPVLDALAYVISQCAGALAAAMALRSVFGVDSTMLGSTSVQLELSSATAVAIEAVMTAILMFVVMGVSTGAKEESLTAGLAVGATIVTSAFVAGPVTNASLNPARSLGPAVASGDTSQLWIYLLGPTAGAVSGAALYRLLLRQRSQRNMFGSDPSISQRDADSAV